MSTNDKKDKNEELFDHIIEYGASSWTDEISPDNIPEEELSDQLNQKIDNMVFLGKEKGKQKTQVYHCPTDCCCICDAAYYGFCNFDEC